MTSRGAVRCLEKLRGRTKKCRIESDAGLRGMTVY